MDLNWIAPTAMAFASLIASCTAAYVAIRAANKTDAVQRDVEAVKIATNHMKDALVAAAIVEGQSQGRTIEKASRAAKDALVANAKRDGVAEATQRAQDVKDGRAEGVAEEQARR